jgi:hypothetical protein
MPIKLKNESNREFIDISSEEHRKYIWRDGFILTLSKPRWLSVSSTGHYIITERGYCYYIPLGWYVLSWKPKPNKPHIVT